MSNFFKIKSGQYINLDAVCRMGVEENNVYYSFTINAEGGRSVKSKHDSQESAQAELKRAVEQATPESLRQVKRVLMEHANNMGKYSQQFRNAIDLLGGWE